MGATGATGRSILRQLLSKPPKDLSLNIYVRNKTKLLQLFPDLGSSSRCQVAIFEGSNTDQGLLQHCLEDVDVGFMCIATNASTPGMTLFTDTASAVVHALEALRSSNAVYNAPTILILRATALNPKCAGEMHGVLRRFCTGRLLLYTRT